MAFLAELRDRIIYTELGAQLQAFHFSHSASNSCVTSHGSVDSDKIFLLFLV